MGFIKKCQQLFQMWMSAIMETTIVQLMLHVQMKWATTHVIAKMVSVAMDSHVKVELDWLFTIIQVPFNRLHKEISTIISDVNECNVGSHECSPNATCTNEMGNYTCDCKNGFNGNGFSCQGRTGLIIYNHLSTIQWAS